MPRGNLLRRPTSSQSMTDFYVRAVSRYQEEARAAKMRAFMEHVSATETTLGTCRAESHSRGFDPVPCLPASMLPAVPSVWNLSQYVAAASRRTEVACGLPSQLE